jgi:GTP-binding protein Era
MQLSLDKVLLLTYRSGFINLLGKPNVGKSTMMNVLVGERLSIITPKAQTTRHRIFGILNCDDFQVVFSDLPGIIENPGYKMQESMMQFVRSALEDADAFLYVVEAGDHPEKQPEIYSIIKKMDVPVLLLINKSDKLSQEKSEEWTAIYRADFPEATILPVSALHKINIDKVMSWILEHLPEGPAYFDKDAITDKPERFFVAEIIREKIFLNYSQEIPYSCEVVVESFKEEEDIIRIRTLIYVERESQKIILIGKQGAMLNKVGMQARADMEAFFGKKIYLETFVKVLPDWRNNERALRSLGYRE